MSNLKQRVQAIQQQLILATADTVARFKEVRTTMDAGFTALRAEMDAGFIKLEQALLNQSETQSKAMDELLSLLVEGEQATQAALADHEARLRRLEEQKPPAA